MRRLPNQVPIKVVCTAQLGKLEAEGRTLLIAEEPRH